MEFVAAGLGGAAGEAAQGGGGCLVSRFHILVFLWHEYVQVLRAVLFIAALTEEEQLLIVFPFGHVEFVRRSAGLDRLVFTVENCAKVLELAFNVFNCKRATNESHTCYDVITIKQLPDIGEDIPMARSTAEKMLLCLLNLIQVFFLMRHEQEHQFVDFPHENSNNIHFTAVLPHCKTD